MDFVSRKLPPGQCKDDIGGLVKSSNDAPKTASRMDNADSASRKTLVKQMVSLRRKSYINHPSSHTIGSTQSMFFCKTEAPARQAL